MATSYVVGEALAARTSTDEVKWRRRDSDGDRLSLRIEEARWIVGIPIWFEEHGDPDGAPLVALHRGILTFEGSFGAVLSWLAVGRRVSARAAGLRAHARRGKWRPRATSPGRATPPTTTKRST